MTIIIPIGLNEADPSGSCCMECCKVGCCACAVTGCLDVDILTWSDVGPSGDLVTSSCASGGGLSFTMCPRLDICGCKEPICEFSEWNTNCFDSTYCYNRTPGVPTGDKTPGAHSPYPSGMCSDSGGDWSGSIMDDYPQMWGFSGTVCGSCTSCGEPAYDAENCGGACIWAAYCCPAATYDAGTPDPRGISTPNFAWGSYPCYDIPPICPSGNTLGSGYGCNVTRENRQVACSPCATRITNRCVPYNCPYNRAGLGAFATSPSSICGWVDCCDGFLPAQDIDGCACTEPEWHLYPTGSIDGCQNAGWPAKNPCQLGLGGLGAAGWPMMYEELGNWPDTCFTFVSGQCSIPPIGQKFIAVYEGWMANYHCDCQTKMCCDYGFDVDYACNEDTFPSACWQSGTPGGTGTISVDCGSYSCLRTDHSTPGQAADAYSQDIYARIIITES